MTHTVTLVADHLGTTAPKVIGHQYYVDAIIDVTALLEPIVVNGAFVAAANTFTRDAGAAFPTYRVGETVAITGSDQSGNNATVTIAIQAGNELTLSAVATDDTDDDNVTISRSEEHVPYSSFGLSSVSYASVYSQQLETLDWNILLREDGADLLADHLVLKPRVSADGSLPATDCGAIRVRVFGQL